MPAQGHLFDDDEAREESAPAPASDGVRASRQPGEDAAVCAYWDYCPNCGSQLHNQGCKYRCPRCHYFMSCSDFD